MKVRLSPTVGTDAVVIGAGPAGLTAAYQLARRGTRSIVLESLGQVGGLSRTERHHGYHFDIGGHRFFTKVDAVQTMWEDVLGDDFLDRGRLSRLYLDGQYYQYPIEPLEVLLKLGFIESFRGGLSYLKSKLSPVSPVHSVEDWLINNFGERLYRRFFRTYTEKVWGIPCSQISAEWAAQRIRGLSLWTVVKTALGIEGKTRAKSLVENFQYPRLGPGMMWEKTAELATEGGCEVRLNSNVEEIHWGPGGVKAVVAGGCEIRGRHFLSTMPIRELIGALRPRVPALDRVQACFQYRDFLTVALMVRGTDLFPDNWIYIHDPEVRVGRIQNFNNWSPEMSPDSGVTCIGFEYFCNVGDDLWTMTNQELSALARREMGALGLADPSLVEDTAVIRAPKAYPVYNGDHEKGLTVVREFLQQVPNLQLIGRNGMHRYNNQDHSMVTAMLAVENIFGASHDLWTVNVDDEYQESGNRISHEELREMTAQQPLVPEPLRRPA